jgi:Rrf2 family protein
MTSSLYGAGAEYALHSLLIISKRTDPISVRDLARFQKLPEKFLSKLFTRLQKAKLVCGTEGIRGGFVLARSAEEITIREILEAVDPMRSLFECAEIRRHCDLYAEKPPSWSVKGQCRIHRFMEQAENTLRSFLASKTLADIGDEFSGKAPDKFMRDTEIWFQQRRRERAVNRPRASDKGTRKQLRNKNEAFND